MTNDSGKTSAPAAPVLHPMLLALLPLFGLYANNLVLISPVRLARPAVVLVFAAGLLSLLCRLVFRDRHKGGIAASMLIVGALTGWQILESGIAAMWPRIRGGPQIAYYAGYTLLVIISLAALFLRHKAERRMALRICAWVFALAVCVPLIGGLALAPVFGRGPAWLITAYVLLAAVAMTLVLHRKSGFERFTRSANTFAAVVLGLYMILAVIYRPSGILVPPPPLEEAGEVVVKSARESSAPRPDIYLIVLDGYARADVLRAAFAYNNLPFQEAMERLGFTFVAHSTANYPVAPLSLASCLNMDYVQQLTAGVETDGVGLRPVLQLYRNNRVYQFLKGCGYTLSAFSPGIEQYEPQPPMEICLKPPMALSESEVVLMDTTVFGRAMAGYYYVRHGAPAYWRHAFRRERVRWAFDVLSAGTATPSAGPKFVLLHLPIPNPPFLFSRNGAWAQPVSTPSPTMDPMRPVTDYDYIKRYVEQLHFTNTALEKAAGDILARSTRPPVILIVSSHGPSVAQTHPGRTYSEESFGNLIAAYFPATAVESDASWSDTMSLVNLFRVVFNRVFGTSLPLLENKAFTCSEEPPFSFQPIPLP